jgi:hypothetical protein
MNVKLRQIEVDEETAALLEARAGARGITVSELLADIACNQEALPADLAEMRNEGEGPWSSEALEEDARRLAEFERTREGVPWEEVKNWLWSWVRRTSFLRLSPASYEADRLAGGNSRP